MRRSFDLYFASSNRHKYDEAKKILEKFGIRLGFFKFSAIEIQSDSITDIAKQKALDAYKKLRLPVLVEDDGLFVKSLGGFPGPYSSYVFTTIGNAGVISLVKRNRGAEFVSVIAFCNGKSVKIFEAHVKGKVATRQSGKGWGYDPIFVPKGTTKTYAQLSDKNTISHRYNALKKFASWRAGMRQSSGQ